MLPYGRQWISEEDIQTVVETLRGTNLTQGPKIAEFEQALASFCGAKYAVVVNSGTSALHISCLAAGIQAGDEVITSPITFVASANCAFYCGAKPVFADIESETALIDPIEIEKKINSNTRAIIPVHFTGQSAKMEQISSLVKSAEKKWGKKIYLIEDAAHALGATDHEKKIGSCSHSDMTILSFHPVKHITTAEGGAVLTNDPELYQRLQLFRSHGITRELGLLQDRSNQPWGYEQHELGYNYRLPDLLCALGISQLKRLPSFLERRRQIASRYRQAFSDIKGVGLLVDRPEQQNAYHLFIILLNFQNLGGRNLFMNQLQQESGIITQVHYIPAHTQPYFKKKLGTRWGDFPKAENYYEKCLSIPMYPAMTDPDVERVIAEIKKLVSKN